MLHIIEFPFRISSYSFHHGFAKAVRSKTIKSHVHYPYASRATPASCGVRKSRCWRSARFNLYVADAAGHSATKHYQVYTLFAGSNNERSK